MAEPWTRADRLELAKLALVVAGGVWAVFLYVSHQRDANLVALKAAQAELSKTSIALEQAKLDVKKSEIEVEKLAQTPVTTSEEVVIRRLEGTPDWYYVEYNYAFTNSGSKALIVSPLMAEAFIARSPAMGSDRSIIVNDVGDLGALKWEVLSRRGFVAAEKYADGEEVRNGDDSATAEKGGGGTGTIDAGETAEGTIQLLVTGKPTDFVGFRVRLTINDGGAANRQRLREFRVLGDISERNEDES